MGTTFYEIYCRFLEKVTDDMFLEMDEEETFLTMESMLLDSLGNFRFPRFRLYMYDVNYEVENSEGEVISFGAWEDTLTDEEVAILANLMLLEWFRRQLATTRITQMKYSTSDFRMTSQAAHMQRLSVVIEDLRKDISRQQHMYQRRIIGEDGYVKANYDNLASGEKYYNKLASSLGAIGRGINGC